MGKNQIMDMQNAFQNLNWLAIIVAAVSAFILGVSGIHHLCLPGDG